ncbi:nucleoside-diphosphate kinase [Candidatus Falkowbacteria bacterium CG10_big_fil_rev_8_21_14_0_10_37_6]|jgi:nucleoside-diphosphate kinase|uniref:nucleoside-diphosphate kinase n=1 Tax=Candidatus Falkowbacteria bacterium CG10_big_fil_rev_8_21_14_0_10_37_6 TaxID=1974563 RepID=A0A2H0V9B3_9BACT|nr:MAG: nucleoside-diphosphate kinase [Candidatus Falkowbacteria bacterium CG10_big_fil_rev_8_21_14_0_10_37_6]
MTHFKEEQTLILVKGDGVQRGLVGEIISRFERISLKIKAMKMVWPDKNLINRHYDPSNTEWLEDVGAKALKGYEKKGIKVDKTALEIGQHVQENLLKMLSAGPVVAVVLQGAHAVEVVRKIVGSTDPLSAAPGTIRGDYALDSYYMSDTDDRAIRNLIHASGTVDEAKHEIEIWFDSSELSDYVMPYDEVVYDKNWENKQALLNE